MGPGYLGGVVNSINQLLINVCVGVYRKAGSNKFMQASVQRVAVRSTCLSVSLVQSPALADDSKGKEYNMAVNFPRLSGC